MSKKTDELYFDNFVQTIDAACEAAELLRDTFNSFDAATLRARLDDMHAIEHKGDTSRHDMVAAVARAFITPIERTDMTELSQNIDNVTDALEDVLLRIYIAGVRQITDGARQFAELVLRCCEATRNMLRELRNFKRSKTLQGLIIEVNRIEEEGDRLYFDLLCGLHADGGDVRHIVVWREIYDFLEKACDACEDVADVVEDIVIGNI